jgi:adenosylcobinamide kinase/adenosylcobinamide-phosphate guanylyltransferase
MARIVFITGGSRSGKSQHAQQLAESLPGSRVFVATCPVLDDEMRERIHRHRAARRQSRWSTIEETIDLAGAIRRARRHRVVLVDCVTLWINNLLYEAGQRGATISEAQVAKLCRQVIAACREHPGIIIIVSNELGMGIVPDNALSRRYRDLVGRANQIFADASDDARFVVSGQIIALKGTVS